MKARGREGFILVSVLGALIVLAGLVGAVSYLVRTAVVGAAAQREALTTDALLRSGIDLAGFQLFMLRRPAALVTGQRIRLNEGVVTLFVAAESGKIDLNGAPPEALAGLWASIGAPQLRPESFAARVKDYRDEDPEPSPEDGAEAPQYAAAGPNRMPANAPFERVDDVQNVLGVSLEAARALAPMLTVHNPSGKLSAFDATPAVLRILPGGARIADRVRALRTQSPVDEEQLQEALGEAAQFLSVERTSPAYTVRVEAERNGARRAAELILTASRSPDALYFVTDRIDRPAR